LLESPAIHGENDTTPQHKKDGEQVPTVLKGLSGIKVAPTYHPAYLLRNPERKREVWEDMKQIFKWMADQVGIPD
jgi:uracil-DNA glycosylase family 4